MMPLMHHHASGRAHHYQTSRWTRRFNIPDSPVSQKSSPLWPDETTAHKRFGMLKRDIHESVVIRKVQKIFWPGGPPTPHHPLFGNPVPPPSIGLIGYRPSAANSSSPQDMSERPSWEREILHEGTVSFACRCHLLTKSFVRALPAVQQAVRNRQVSTDRTIWLQNVESTSAFRYAW